MYFIVTWYATLPLFINFHVRNCFTNCVVHAYSTQFARLRSPSQFAVVQLLSSFSVVVIFPLQMTKQWHRLLQIIIGYPQTWEDHVNNVATTFFCRGLAQNVTMVGFLGECIMFGTILTMIVNIAHACLQVG